MARAKAHLLSFLLDDDDTLLPPFFSSSCLSLFPRLHKSVCVLLYFCCSTLLSPLCVLNWPSHTFISFSFSFPILLVFQHTHPHSLVLSRSLCSLSCPLSPQPFSPQRHSHSHSHSLSISIVCSHRISFSSVFCTLSRFSDRYQPKFICDLSHQH